MISQEQFINFPKYEKDPAKDKVIGQLEQFGIHIIIKEEGQLYKKRVNYDSHFLKETPKFELLYSEDMIKSWQYQNVDPARRE